MVHVDGSYQRRLRHRQPQPQGLQDFVQTRQLRITVFTQHPVEDFAGQMRFAGSYRLAQCQGLRTLLQHQELIHRHLLDCLL